MDGTAPGETQGVEDVAVSPDGSAVYVTDDGNRRIHQYAPDGTVVRTWGQDGTDGGDLGGRRRSRWARQVTST